MTPRTGRARMALALALMCLGLRGTAATISNYSLSELRRWEGECGELTECFCILDTRCGWCATTDSAGLGTSKGPRDGFCPNWVQHAYDCDLLHCSSHDDLRGWLAEISSFPLAVFLLWGVALRWQRRFQLKVVTEHAQLPPGVRKRSGMERSNTGTIALSPSTSSRPPSAEAGAAAPFLIRTEVAAEEVDLDSLPEFFRFRRTYEAFRKGLDCPRKERVPDNERIYQLNLDHFEKRFSKTAVIRLACHAELALGQTLPSTASLMLVAALYVTMLRVAARFLAAERYNQIAMATVEMGAVVSTLQMAVNMLLTFYTLNRIAWLWSLYMEGTRLQGRAHDVAMLAGTAPRSSEEDWRRAYVLYRHIMLAFYFAYKNFVPQFRERGCLELRACGLLTPEEAALLEKAHRLPGTVVEAWIARWIQEHLRDEARQQTFFALRELRASMAGISDWCHQRAPVSFETLLFSAVFALCFVMPFGPSHIDYKDRHSVMTSPHISPVLGCTVVTSFYLALVNFLRTIQQPFGRKYPANPDALNPEFILLITERKLRDYLSTDYPPGTPGSKQSSNRA